MARPIKNNADYFSHDSDMRDDPKIKTLRRKYGLEGYAIWSMLLEVLTDSERFKYKNDDLSMEILAGDFDINKQKLIEIINYLVKLELLNNGDNYLECNQLTKRFSALISNRERDRSRVIDSENTSITSENQVDSGDNPHSKEEKSKEEKSKEVKSESKLSIFYKQQKELALSDKEEKNVKVPAAYIEIADYVLAECPNICKLPNQLKYSEFKKITDKLIQYNKNHEKHILVWDIIDAMENKKDLTRKYTSFYRTLNNWINRRINE